MHLALNISYFFFNSKAIIDIYIYIYIYIALTLNKVGDNRFFFFE